MWKGCEVAVFTVVVPLLSHMLTVASMVRSMGRRPYCAMTKLARSAAFIMPSALMS